MLLPIAGGAPSKKPARPQTKLQRSRLHRSAGRGRGGLTSLSARHESDRRCVAMSMKKLTPAEDDKGLRAGSMQLVTAVMLAIAVGVAPRLTPVKPAEITAPGSSTHRGEYDEDDVGDRCDRLDGSTTTQRRPSPPASRAACS